MNVHEENAEYTQSVIPQLEAIDKQLGESVESGKLNMSLHNLSQWHEDYLIDYARLEHSALPKTLQYLIP